MLVWILQTGEPLHIDNDNFRPMRAMNLSNKLVDSGHKVILWSSAFVHQTKKHRSKKYKTHKVNDNLEIYRSKEGMYASIRYSGYNNNEKQVFYTEKLLNKIKELKKEIIGTPILLSYDSPYKFYNRRNEILMELSN